MLYFAEFLHTRVFRNIVDFLFNFTLLKSMVTGSCHCVSVSLYHLITEFALIPMIKALKGESLPRGRGTSTGFQKRHCLLGDNGIEISNQGQRSFL